MKKTLLSTALILGSFGVSAFAGTSDYSCHDQISGSLYAGYSNYYSNHNLVPAGAWVDKGVISTGASLKYEIPNTIDIVAEICNTQLDTGAVPYSDFLPIKDATDVYLGIQGERIPGLVTALGYNLADGGLPGYMADMRKFARSNGDLGKFLDGSTMDHQIRFDIRYQIPNSGWAFNGNVTYSVNGTEGWLMDVGTSYTWTPSDCVSIILSGNVSFSQNYMYVLDSQGRGQKLNGIDGYSISLTIPVKLSETVSLIPYVSCKWAGHNAIAYSKFDKQIGAPGAFKNFAPVAGVAVTWSF